MLANMFEGMVAFEIDVGFLCAILKNFCICVECSGDRKMANTNNVKNPSDIERKRAKERCLSWITLHGEDWENCTIPVSFQQVKLRPVNSQHSLQVNFLYNC